MNATGVVISALQSDTLTRPITLVHLNPSTPELVDVKTHVDAYTPKFRRNGISRALVLARSFFLSPLALLRYA
jgi:hypothetical protein